MRTLLAITTVFVLAGPLRAQEPLAGSHEQAAAELLELMRMEEMTRASAEMMLETMLAQNPVLEQFRDVFVDFFDEYIRWDDLLPEYVAIYTDAYTEPELRELIAFYRTPVGQKTIDLMPRLMQAGAALGEAQIQPHLPELQRRIQERMVGDPRP